MTPQQFIKKMIEGGRWEGRKFVKFDGDFFHITHDNSNGTYMIPIDSVLLDPLAWQAVGKVEGWKEDVCQFCGKKTTRFGDDYVGYKECKNSKCDIGCQCTEENYLKMIDEWKYNMHRMIDALCNGESIEQFLETL